MKRKDFRTWLTAGLLSLGMLCSIRMSGTGTENVYAAITDGKVLVEGLNRAADYYILPGSATEELSSQAASALQDSVKQMAINEIYARRGRKFVIPEVQQYFDEKSWYKGTVEADDFDESVFNDYENINIQKLLKAMNSSENTQSEVIVDFAGEYKLLTKDREAYLQLSVYTDISPADAEKGRECGTVNLSVYYTNGGMESTTAYLQKNQGNTYTLVGRRVTGAALTVTADGVTISGSDGADGSYVKSVGYES